MTNVNRRLVTDEVRELVVSALLSDPSYVLGRRYAEDAFDGWLSDQYIQSSYQDGYETGYAEGRDSGVDDGYESGYSEGYDSGIEAGRE